MRQLDTPYQFDISEPLPYAPTYQRSFMSYTAFDAASRLYTLVATDYPESGIDSYWSVTINGAVNATTPVMSNVMVPHPDASVSNPGKLTLIRLMQVSTGNVVAVFTDGSVHSIDLVGQKYTKIASIIPSGASYSDLAVTTAHVMDGLKLKSFLVDARDQTYLVVTDFSVSPATVSTPLAIVAIKGQPGKEIPMAAVMMANGAPGSAQQLVLIMHGNFDSISWVDETTGEQNPMFASMTNGPTTPCEFTCDTNTKDCDMWNMQAYDPVANALYFQAHDVSNGDDDVPPAAIMQLAMTQSAATKAWYPVSFVVAEPVQFGYMGYQWVQFEQ